MDFEWDENKALLNEKAHNITFEEALTVFYDSNSVIADDIEHSNFEVREIIIGLSESGRLLTVIFTERSENIRLISARKSTKTEAKKYEKRI
ncbi:MAG TPA: BrnT family toxin [Patescibacteria group bacterium]|nr:BrnT family toxin [Patescibacteria group bacterium]